MRYASSIASRYQQYCPVARALEIVGERWTLLIARELLLGPRRFTDLHAGLPGISTNVLTNRLKDLEQGGLVTRRVLPAPAASVVYELAADATGLAGVLAAMASWGTDLLGQPRPDDIVRPAWLVLGLSVGAPLPVALPDGVYEFRIERERGEVDPFHIRVKENHFEPAHGAANDPDAIVTMAETALLAFASGELDPHSRGFGRRVTVIGDKAGAMSVLGWLTPTRAG